MFRRNVEGHFVVFLCVSLFLCLSMCRICCHWFEDTYTQMVNCIGAVFLQDLLPFFPEFTTIEHFKDPLCACLKEHSGKIMVSDLSVTSIHRIFFRLYLFRLFVKFSLFRRRSSFPC